MKVPGRSIIGRQPQTDSNANSRNLDARLRLHRRARAILARGRACAFAYCRDHLTGDHRTRNTAYPPPGGFWLMNQPAARPWISLLHQNLGALENQIQNRPRNRVKSRFAIRGESLQDCGASALLWQFDQSGQAGAQPCTNADPFLLGSIHPSSVYNRHG
jgi:hypothetical protein